MIICWFVMCVCVTVLNARIWDTQRYHTTASFTQTSFHSVVMVMIYYPSLVFEVQHGDCCNRKL